MKSDEKTLRLACLTDHMVILNVLSLLIGFYQIKILYEKEDALNYL